MPPIGLGCSETQRCPDGQSCVANFCQLGGGGDGGGGDTSCAAGSGALTELQRLTAADGQLSDNFGQRMATDGGWLLVGVENDDDRGNNAGAAYLFRSDGRNWTQTVKLTADDGAADDRFGSAVAISGDVLAVGARGESSKGVGAGAAYVFEFNGTDWVQADKLLASDGLANDGFGSAVATAMGHVAVGAPSASSSQGQVYIFTKPAGTWTQHATLTAADATIAFGGALAMTATTLAIGSPGDDDNGSFSGSVFVLNRSGEDWQPTTKLKASDGAMNDQFGQAVALTADRLLIGAPGNLQKGAAYVFDGVGTWAAKGKLVATDGATDDNLGQAVALSDNLVVVGAPSDDDGGTSAGAAYTFVATGGSFSQTSKLRDLQGAEFDLFGSSLVVVGSEVIAGTPLFDRDAQVANTGAAIVFSPACP